MFSGQTTKKEKGIFTLITKNKSRLNINLPATASIWYVAANMISRGATFLFTPLLTRMLPPEEYGIYSLYTSYMGIFTVVTTLEISGSAAYRGLSKFDGEERHRFASSALGIQILLSASFFTLYMLFRSLVNGTTSLTTSLTVFLFIQVFFNSAQGIYFAKKRYSYDYKTVSLINILSGILSPILSLVMIRLGIGGEARVIAPLTVSAAFAVPIIYNLLIKGKRLYSGDVWKFILSISLPMLPHYLSLSVIAQSDKIIIAKMLGESAVGKYSVAYSAGFMLSLLTGGLTLGLTPWMMRKLKSRDIEAIKDALSAAASIICVLTLIFLAAVPEIFSFIAPLEYQEAAPAVYPVSISVIFSFLGTLLTNCILYYDKPRLVLRNSSLSAAISILSSLFLIGKFGYIGGAYSTLLSYFIFFLLNRFTCRKLAGKSIPETKNTVKNITLLLFFGSLLFILRFSLTARIILIFAFILIFTPEIKKCKSLISR